MSAPVGVAVGPAGLGLRLRVQPGPAGVPGSGPRRHVVARSQSGGWRGVAGVPRGMSEDEARQRLAGLDPAGLRAGAPDRWARLTAACRDALEVKPC